MTMIEKCRILNVFFFVDSQIIYQRIIFLVHGRLKWCWPFEVRNKWFWLAQGWLINCLWFWSIRLNQLPLILAQELRKSREIGFLWFWQTHTHSPTERERCLFHKVFWAKGCPRRNHVCDSSKNGEKDSEQFRRKGELHFTSQNVESHAMSYRSHVWNTNPQYWNVDKWFQINSCLHRECLCTKYQRSCKIQNGNNNIPLLPWW